MNRFVFKTLVIAAIAVSAVFTSCNDLDDPECETCDVVEECEICNCEECETCETCETCEECNCEICETCNCEECDCETCEECNCETCETCEECNCEECETCIHEPCDCEDAVTIFTVTFKNGDIAVKEELVADGSKLLYPKLAPIEGYTFAGWYRDAALTTEWKFNVDIVSSDISLYAKWIPFVNIFGLNRYAATPIEVDDGKGGIKNYRVDYHFTDIDDERACYTNYI